MYEQGVRGFGLSFDDLEYEGEDNLLVEEDQIMFSDIGEAHQYFITEVYNRLKQRHNDIEFMVVPLYYKRSNNFLTRQRNYLQNLAQLPSEITLISSEYFNEDIETLSALTNHKILVWDNLYAFTYTNKQEPNYVVPFVNPASWDDPFIRSKLSGFASLPRSFKDETTAGVSWYTMADFSWRPENYNHIDSFNRALP
jgi:hypothetical protein